MKIKTTTLTLKDSYMLTPSVKHFAFTYEEGALNPFIPGQFITMHFEQDGKAYKRSYSIANRQQSNTIEFAAGYVSKGPATEMLFALQPGDEIQANGPFGRLILKEEASTAQRLILVATSTGVTPYRAMLDSLADMLNDNPSFSVHIVLGVRNQQEALYQNEFIEFSSSYAKANFTLCYSRVEDESLSEHEFSGYVQKKLVSLNPNPDSDIVYLCGNPAMVDECHAALTELDFNIKQIRREKYISR